jgi:hypothetical protein
MIGTLLSMIVLAVALLAAVALRAWNVAVVLAFVLGAVMFASAAYVLI